MQPNSKAMIGSKTSNAFLQSINIQKSHKTFKRLLQVSQRIFKKYIKARIAAARINQNIKKKNVKNYRSVFGFSFSFS